MNARNARAVDAAIPIEAGESEGKAGGDGGGGVYWEPRGAGVTDRLERRPHNYYVIKNNKCGLEYDRIRRDYEEGNLTALSHVMLVTRCQYVCPAVTVEQAVVRRQRGRRPVPRCLPEDTHH
ncbi:unnamed protein product [Chrysodeixis includens]|uniref:Uncharacterized protein n=1 Tax=Chrysodeixis includens TaxID=689277 RepID=A0A9N8L117_CHRIL|nr:unnamed protein product [Chrysodeixis includens]